MKAQAPSPKEEPRPSPTWLDERDTGEKKAPESPRIQASTTPPTDPELARRFSVKSSALPPAPPNSPASSPRAEALSRCAPYIPITRSPITSAAVQQLLRKTTIPTKSGATPRPSLSEPGESSPRKWQEHVTTEPTSTTVPVRSSKQ